jgi:hypothetical protein
VESYYERHFGVATGKEVMLDSLGIHDPDAVRYSPTPYPAFFRAMKLVGADLSSSVLVDYGAGLGRIVVCAASLPLAGVIGIEFAGELVRRCNGNLECARHRLACKEVAIVHGNAMTWCVPPNVNIFHFYNPFLGQTLRATVGEISRSLHNVPREVWILFGSPWEMTRIMAAGEIIPKAWVRSERDVPWPFHKEMTDRDPNGFRYRVYQIDSRL